MKETGLMIALVNYLKAREDFPVHSSSVNCWGMAELKLCQQSYQKDVS